jgi:hypothetical protein
LRALHELRCSTCRGYWQLAAALVVAQVASGAIA